MKPNNDTAAICGLFCGTCPSYPNYCHGCLSDKLTAHCITCSNGFRQCAKENNVKRCYSCKEFPCERLTNFRYTHCENGIYHHAHVIENLQFMKDFSVEKWAEKEIVENTCPKCGKLIHWADKNNHNC